VQGRRTTEVDADTPGELEERLLLGGELHREVGVRHVLQRDDGAIREGAAGTSASMPFGPSSVPPLASTVLVIDPSGFSCENRARSIVVCTPAGVVMPIRSLSVVFASSVAVKLPSGSRARSGTCCA
jgi:hypothetical protein